eukprot:3861313-Amphidinium_carterae.1
MPAPATNLTFRHEVTINHPAVRIRPQQLEGNFEAGRKRPPAPAWCPEVCPCAKTLCMAKDCHKTLQCSAMAKLLFGVFVQISTVAES